MNDFLKYKDCFGLRIGNHLSYLDNSVVIQSIAISIDSDKNLFYISTSKSGIQTHLCFQPINISEEWLLKFGFYSDEINEGDEPTYLSKKYPNFYIDYKTLQPIDGGFNIANFKLKYIHQLQNLFFAISGNELEIII